MASFKFNVISIFLVISFYFLNAVIGNCSKSSDCDIEGTICVKGKCNCPSGYILNGEMTSCIMVAEGFGWKCEESLQCSAKLKNGGACLNGTCQCAPGYHYLLGNCWKTSGLGESCNSNENCLVDYDLEASTCSKGTCTCSPGYYQREYTSCRRISNRVDEPCALDIDCQFENGMCRRNRTCGTKDEQPSSYKPEPPKPSPQPSSAQLGQKCSRRGDCKVANSECGQAGLCVCQIGYYPVNNTFCFAEIGTRCSSNADCQGSFTSCRKSAAFQGQSVCLCEEGRVAANGNTHCLKQSRELNWSCLEDRWCSLFGPKSRCIERRCHCGESSHYVPDVMYCWHTAEVGGQCLDVKDCGGNSTVEPCVKGVCECAPDFHPKHDKLSCYPDGQYVADSCLVNADCIFDHAICNATQCVCSPGYMVSNRLCVPGVGGKCSTDSDCQAKQAQCQDGECRCPEGMTSSVDFSQCLDIVNSTTAPCVETAQCTQVFGKGSECSSQRCCCRKGFHLNDNHCYEDVELYANCTSTPQCQVHNKYTECRNSFCKCAFDHPPDIFNKTCTSGGSVLSQHILQILWIFQMFVVLVFNK